MARKRKQQETVCPACGRVREQLTSWDEYRTCTRCFDAGLQYARDNPEPEDLAYRDSGSLRRILPFRGDVVHRGRLPYDPENDG